MLLICTLLGRKHYPVPYRWGKILGFFVLMGVVYVASLLLDRSFFSGDAMAAGDWGLLSAKLLLHTVLIIFYAAASWVLLRRRG